MKKVSSALPDVFPSAPDLAIEIDVSHSSLNRMGIYAALGVPEVWRLTAEGLSFNVLEADVYQISPSSRSFPNLTSEDLLPFLKQLDQAGSTDLIARFREWVRQVLVARGS